MGRFVEADSPAMDALVAETVAKVGAEVEALRIPRLGGVVLGGGYGRGEGGVIADGGGERLSNDLDFYVVSEEGASSGDLAAIDAALAPVAARWTKRLRVDVDFCPAKTPWRIRHDQERVMIQELLHGYVDVAGKRGEELFRSVERRGPEMFPWMEAARLLMNRGAGLLFALVSEDPEFVARNLNKCVLGAGDARLITRRQYKWKVKDRAAALGDPLYSAAVEWKFRPRREAVCDWEEARRTWLDAEVAVMETGRAEGATRRSLYQAARWVVRRRSLGELRTFGQDAVVRALRRIAGAVKSRRAMDASLERDWLVFN